MQHFAHQYAQHAKVLRHCIIGRCKVTSHSLSNDTVPHNFGCAYYCTKHCVTNIPLYLYNFVLD